jgi:hypothetical protein
MLWRLLAAGLPGFAAAFAIVFWPRKGVSTGELMAVTGTLAAAFTVYALRALLRRIREAFASVSHLGVLDPRRPSAAAAGGGNVPLGADSTRGYLLVVSQKLNWWPGEAACGAAVTAIATVMVVRQWNAPATTMPDHVAMSFEVLVAPAMGAMCLWRVLVGGWAVWGIPHSFDIRPQSLHPDGCGGLAPVGRICLTMVLFLTPVTLYLAGWLTVWELDIYQGGRKDWSGTYLALLGVPLALSVATVVVPLLGVHVKLMDQKAAFLTKELDPIAARIDENASLLRNAAKSRSYPPATHTKQAAIDLVADEEVLQAVTAKNERLRRLYADGRHFPVWPLNTRMVTRVFAPQTLATIVALASLVDLRPNW